MSEAARFRTLLIGLGIVCGCAYRAYAQEPPVLVPGGHIRARVVDSSRDGSSTRRVKGTILNLSDTTITISTSGDVILDLRRPDVERLEVRLRPSRRGRGALIGLGIGAASGLLIGFAAGDDPPGLFSFSAQEKAVGLAVLLAPIGALVGLVAAPGAQWVTVPPEGGIHVSFDNRRPGRYGLCVTIPF